MNTVELLLGLDYEKVKAVPEKKLKIPRLSEVAGNDFIVTVRAISSRRFLELTGSAMKNGEVDFSKLYDANVRIALAGLADPDLKDAALLEHYHAASPADLMGTIFTGSEINQIAEAVRDLSGYGDAGGAVEEVKN